MQIINILYGSSKIKNVKRKINLQISFNPSSMITQKLSFWRLYDKIVDFYVTSFFCFLHRLQQNGPHGVVMCSYNRVKVEAL